MYSQEKVKLSEIKTLTPLHLGMSVDIDEPVKLGHVWKLIGDQKDFLCQYLRIPYLNELIEEANTEPKENEKRDESWVLENIELYYEIGKSSGEFYGSWIVHGIGKYKGEEANLALDMTSPREFRDVDVIFKKDIQIADFDKTDELQDKKIKGRKIPTVLDVIDAIVYEFTFYGCPQKRDKQFEELKEMSEQIHEEYSHEEVKERVLGKLKNEDQHCS